MRLVLGQSLLIYGTNCYKVDRAPKWYKEMSYPILNLSIIITRSKRLSVNSNHRSSSPWWARKQICDQQNQWPVCISTVLVSQVVVPSLEHLFRSHPSIQHQLNVDSWEGKRVVKLGNSFQSLSIKASTTLSLDLCPEFMKDGDEASLISVSHFTTIFVNFRGYKC